MFYPATQYTGHDVIVVADFYEATCYHWADNEIAATLSVSAGYADTPPHDERWVVEVTIHRDWYSDYWRSDESLGDEGVIDRIWFSTPAEARGYLICSGFSRLYRD